VRRTAAALTSLGMINGSWAVARCKFYCYLPSTRQPLSIMLDGEAQAGGVAKKQREIV
jgi:hypothetical protein